MEQKPVISLMRVKLVGEPMVVAQPVRLIMVRVPDEVDEDHDEVVLLDDLDEEVLLAFVARLPILFSRRI